MKLLIIFTLSLLISILNGYIDYRLFKHPDYKINHGLESVVRAVIFAVISLLIYAPNWTHVLYAILISFASFWIAFEITFNYLRKSPILYVGKTALSDRLVQKYFPNPKGVFYLIFKVIILTTFIILIRL